MFVWDFPWKSHHPKLAWGTPIMGIQPTAYHQPLWIPGGWQPQNLHRDDLWIWDPLQYLVGGGYLALWKMMEWVTVGMMKFPICGKIKTVPNHQPGIFLIKWLTWNIFQFWEILQGTYFLARQHPEKPPVLWGLKLMFPKNMMIMVISVIPTIGLWSICITPRTYVMVICDIPIW